MSIAEKLTTVAENQQRVYDAGHKAAVNRYCPDFIETDSIVSCKPVGGYPLGIISQITPIQAGSGDASPTNIRPLSAHTAVKVTIANGTDTAEHNVEFGQDVYAGNFDWSTGLLTLTHKMLTLTGEESGWKQANSDSIMNTSLFNDSKKETSNIYGWCSHAHTESDGRVYYYQVHKGYNGGYFEAWDMTNYWGLPDNEVSTWTNYLKEQMLNGTPVQVLYQLEVPITVQLTPQEILALDGTNTVYSDTGDTTVTGKGDGVAMAEELKDIIISLGGEV